jgi:hypothetical protein
VRFVCLPLSRELDREISQAEYQTREEKQRERERERERERGALHGGVWSESTARYISGFARAAAIRTKQEK